MNHNELSQVGFLLHVTCQSARDQLICEADKADLLLLESPFWEFDLVREQITSTEGMSESELATKCLKSMSGLTIPPSSGLWGDLDDEVVISISGKSIPVSLYSSPSRASS